MAALLTANCPQCPEHPICKYLPFHAAGNVARKFAVFAVFGLVTKLPETYAKAIGDAGTGTVLPVFTMAGSGGREQFVVLQVTDRRPEGEIRYEDVKDRIREQLGQQLAIRRYIDRLRNSTYVEIRT